MRTGKDEQGGECLLVPGSVSSPSAVLGFKDTSRDVDEDEYEETIERHDDVNKSIVGVQHEWASERVLVYSSDLVTVAHTDCFLRDH
jgi:hypothetical protein